MFFLIGLGIMAVVGLTWLVAGASFLNALAQKRHLQAAILALPVWGLVFLVAGSINYGNYAAEATPDRVFYAVFRTPPTAEIQALRGFRDDDELSPVYLAFTASPKVVARLTAGRFTRLPKGERALFSVDHWRHPPAWFNTQITQQTQIFRQNNTLRDSNYLLFYEPRTKTVRVYFQAPPGDPIPKSKPR